MSGPRAQAGSIRRVSGPIVDAVGMASAQAYEVVRVGPQALIGEVIKLAGDVATIQVYEHTGGLRPGDGVQRTGAALSLVLAPGLLGSIFDGIQRPLSMLAEQTGAFLKPGVVADPLDVARKWRFVPRVRPDQELRAGEAFGVVQETRAIEHRLLVSPGMEGKVSTVEPEGKYAITDVLCVMDGEAGPAELTMIQRWPVRRPRPFRRRRASTQVLVTGQRVIDTFFPIARGGTAAVPGDFGTGKTILQHQFAKWSDADVVVYVGCGERGNEMT
ncbi:MAG: V-type ATP synthase subunit A, partial [Candidatus Brocadiae bacterium]|nr:V-type ATP synthase subunit A [Candidatus Brocadiia bacterium]